MFVTVYCPSTITGAGIALLHIAVPRFVDHCKAKARAFVGQFNTRFAPCFEIVRVGDAMSMFTVSVTGLELERFPAAS